MPMTQDETKLQMVQRHVREGASHVQRQREIVAHLRATGCPTETAEMLLSNFEEVQQQHEAHLARMENGQDGEAGVVPGGLIGSKPL